MRKILLNKIKSTSPYYKKYYALIDDKDYKKVNGNNWHIKKDKGMTYAETNIKVKSHYKLFTLHRLVMGIKNVDHINGNGLDCRRKNLRRATQHQNIMNRRANKKSTSKYKGVSYHKITKKWNAQIQVNGNKINLGYFNSERQAGKVYNKRAKQLFGKFANLNFRTRT